jgi:acylglycerol lipase
MASEALAPADLFKLTERAEPLRLREAEPHVYGYAWRHPSPQASLVLVHGLQSHAQWFAQAAEELTARGLSVYALDRRGSGSSPELTGHVGRYADWFEEVADVVRLARSEHPTAPVHLVGHCFGANVALGAALASPGLASSVVMLTPGLYVRPDYSPREKLAIAARGLLDPKARFRVPQEDDLFTRDPDVLAWIRSDSSGARTLTARCLLQISSMTRFLRRNAGKLRIPLLVLEAARDRISHNERNRQFLERELVERCRWVTYDAEHFLLAEPCRDEVLDELVRWTDEKR